MSNIIPFRPRRFDTHVNLITGFGTKADHAEQFHWVAEPRVSRGTLESMYADHPIVWKLVDLFPDDGLREWITINHDRCDELLKALKRLCFRKQLNYGLKMARLHGGAALYVHFEGQDPEEPLNWENPGTISDISVLDKDYIWPEQLNRSMRFNHYCVNTEDAAGARVHKDRIIDLQGESVSRDWQLQNGGWFQSSVARCRKPLLAYSLSHNLVPNIIKDFIRDVIKLQGLNELSINTCEQDMRDFNDRLHAMLLAQSMFNKTVIDKEDEYQRSTTSVAGLHDLIRNPEKALVAASGIPHTKLLGESPGGTLSQAGNSQERDWHKAVSAYQEDRIRPAIEKMLLMLAPSLGIRDDIPFAFNPLDAVTQKEQAEMLKLVAEATFRMLEAQAWTVEEARTLFAGEELKMLPVLDQNTSRALAAMKGLPNDEEIKQTQRNPAR
ncbi:MAG: DUF1073 domain-containing protein [Candidatus Sericytochromatia bacterium]|nr:DUF1073 domain-containing protein [Candidatus Sericytochromatia bacterium]